MQKYRGVGMILLLVVLVFGAAAASVALEESAPGAASVIRRLVVVAGAGLVLTLWSEWSDRRARKKQAAGEVKDDAA